MNSDEGDRKRQKNKLIISAEDYFGSKDNVVFFNSYYEMEGFGFPDLFRRVLVKNDRESLLCEVAAPRATRIFVNLFTANRAIEKRKEKERKQKQAKKLVDDILKKFFKKEDV